MPSSFFAHSFDTFKAFDGLRAEQTGSILPGSPKTIWEILSHLVIWQEYHLQTFLSSAASQLLSEEITWPSEQQASGEVAWQALLQYFYQQLATIQNEITTWHWEDVAITTQLKIAQEWSLHLAFHVGEVVLLRSTQGPYPLPHQTKAFLTASSTGD